MKKASASNGSSALSAMIRIRQLILPLAHTEQDLLSAVAKKLCLDSQQIVRLVRVRQSLDARKHRPLVWVYTVDVELAENEAAVLAALNNSPDVEQSADRIYQPPVYPAGCPIRPVIVGAGPCGLFAALILAQAGAQPIVVERGKPVAERVADVQRFWKEGILNPDSNAVFGEGGAGTFSDGKLTTQIKDKHGRIRKVIEELIAAGAPREIAWQAKPHIGTDLLRSVICRLRQRIVELGGQFLFETCVAEIVAKKGRLEGLKTQNGLDIPAPLAVVACGHSAADTLEMLYEAGAVVKPKPFSLGVRIEHLQEMINRQQYHQHWPNPALPPASYRLVCHCPNGRSVYTFCMCPGGVVMAAASEPETVVTNGMSYHARDGVNANSAVLVGVGVADFAQADNPLAGLSFRRHWERKAYQLGGGHFVAPAQRVADFLSGKSSRHFGSILPTYQPAVVPANLADCLPPFVVQTLQMGLPQLDQQLRGFAMPDAVLTGVETRSSCPVRLVRDETGQSVSLHGLFPAGEGAGYAGGIISSAVDGIKIAEAVCLAAQKML